RGDARVFHALLAQLDHLRVFLERLGTLADLKGLEQLGAALVGVLGSFFLGCLLGWLGFLFLVGLGLFFLLSLAKAGHRKQNRQRTRQDCETRLKEPHGTAS